MLVKDLIEILSQIDPKAVVVLSRDPEGNSFAAIEDYTEGFFDNRRAEFWSEEDFFDEEDVDEEEEEDTDVEWKTPHGLPAIVFWPGY